MSFVIAAGGLESTPAQIACADYNGGNRVAVYNTYTSRMNIHVRDDTIFFTNTTGSE